MKLLIALCFFFTSTFIFSQEKSTKYYNSFDSVVTKDSATKYAVEYFDSSKQRIYKEFYDIDDNTILKRAYYINDTTMDGLFVQYINDRQIWDSGYMKMGFRFGITYFYHNNGKLASVIDLKKDTKIFIECYDESGVKMKCTKEIEYMPEFPGKVEALMKYMRTNVNYPRKAAENAIQGKVIVKFYVDIDGKVKNPVVLKSVDPLLDEEAIRVVKKMPDWKPGIQFNRKVKVYYTLPVSFKLQ